MKKPALVRKVFRELLESTDSVHSEVELLEAAKEIVEVAYDYLDDEPQYSVSENRRDFDSVDLHTAMTENPWRVVRRESEMMTHFFSHQSGCIDNFVFGVNQYA